MAPNSGAKPNSSSSAANLANLLPTGTVLAYQALTPSLSNNGTCLAVHKYLTIVVIACCSIVCFFSAFTDSHIFEGKLYHGIATTKGLYIFNKNHEGGNNVDNDLYKIRWIDFVHAFTSLLVFLVFATANTDVRSCFFPHPGPSTNVLLMHLPILVGAFASFLFMLFPTKRKGFGYAYADLMAPSSSPSPNPSPENKKATHSTKSLNTHQV